jgi:hypothetical protein
MSILNSKFDIVSVDNPLAVAALAQVLEVLPGTGALYSGTGFDGGTPVNQADALIPPGAIVEIDGATGKAKLASSAEKTADAKLLFVAIDGNTDYSGKFVRKVTVLHGGFTMLTDQVIGSAFTPGTPVYVSAGKVTADKAEGSLTDARPFGFVGPAGFNAAEGTLQVIVPQGAGI